MPQGTTVEAVRLALAMHEVQARVASTNIAHANQPDARALRMDFAHVQSQLERAASSAGRAPQLLEVMQELRRAEPESTEAPIQVDVEVGDMVAATLEYQTLAEALGRHFSLMRLSITGRP
jgi:flagellar basal-body rod protein FlgB